MKFSKVINDWYAYRQRMCGLGLVADTTLKAQMGVAATILGSLGNIDIAAIRKSDIEFYLGERRRSCKPVTLRGELNLIRQIMNWAVDEGLLVQKPRMPTVSVPNVEAAMFSDADIGAALAALPPHIARACKFMALTGLSPAELSQLRAGDYDAATNSIGIGQRADFRVKQPSRRRWVPLCEEALALWHQPTKPFEPPFPRVPAMQAAMSRARAAGAPAITPKVMRKWFASQVSGLAPEHVLQRLLGHAPGSKVTRRHYVRSSDSATAAAVVGLSIPQGARA